MLYTLVIACIGPATAACSVPQAGELTTAVTYNSKAACERIADQWRAGGATARCDPALYGAESEIACIGLSEPHAGPVESSCPKPTNSSDIIFTIDPAPHWSVLVTQAPQHMFIANSKGETLVDLNMETGTVKLSGNPNEAAKIFWDAMAKWTSVCKH